MSRKKTSLADMASPLPPELGELVLRVVRRTKLWPGEKRDVARELTGHFLDGLETLERNDGLDAPAATKQLALDFGDERMAAKLIRRSKKRCRPLAWKVFMLSVRTFCVGFGLIALLAGWRMTGTPNPRINYVAQLNAAAESIPESEKAWPLYREAISRFPDPTLLGFGETYASAWETLTPDHEAWPEVRQWLRDCDPVVDLLEAAGNKPFYGAHYDVKPDPIFLRFEYDRLRKKGDLPENLSFESWLSERTPTELADKNDVPMMMQVLLPSLSPMRDMARMMVLRSRDHAARGHITEATDDLLIVLQMGNHLLGEKFLIPQLVGAKCIQLADQGLRDLLFKPGEARTSESLQKIAHAWAGSIPADGFHVRLESERLAFIDIVQHVFTENPWGDGHLVIRGRNGWGSLMGGSPTTAALLHAGRKATLEKFDEIWAAMMERMSAPLYSSERSDVDAPIQAWARNPWQGPATL